MENNQSKEKTNSHWCYVKWYNPFKGFGFVMQADARHEKDIFLHFSVLEPLNLMQIRQGDKILGSVETTSSGLQMTEVFKVVAANPFLAENPVYTKPKKISPPRFMTKEDNAALNEVQGEIKWYSRLRGYGFATVKGIKKDVFVHGALLEEANIQALKPGQPIRLWIALSTKGPEARRIKLL